MALREKQTAERRTRILDCAEQIIRETEGVDFSMRALAAASEVSPATPYNLFGSKEALLYALLARSLDEITRVGLTFESQDPLDRVLESADKATDVFLDDPSFLQPLYQFLLGVIHPVYRPEFIERSLRYWRTALAGAEEGGLLSDGFDIDALAHTLMAHFMGILEFWVNQDIGDTEFRAYVAFGTALQLWPLARGARLDALREQIQANQRLLKREAPIPIFKKS